MIKVCVIGSLRCEKEMKEIADKLNCYRPKSEDNLELARLKCYEAIVNSDVVLVYGYHIGEDTKYEIDLARRMGKIVSIIEPLDDVTLA